MRQFGAGEFAGGTCHVCVSVGRFSIGQPGEAYRTTERRGDAPIQPAAVEAAVKTSSSEAPNSDQEFPLINQLSHRIIGGAGAILPPIADVPAPVSAAAIGLAVGRNPPLCTNYPRPIVLFPMSAFLLGAIIR